MTPLTRRSFLASAESRVQGSQRLETPDLDIRYTPPTDSGFMRGEYVRPAG
jgi:hypothetical protein